jgi:hypothetical protein
LELDVTCRVAEEPQTIVVNARMRNGQLLCGDIRMRKSKLAND